jgi:hypothetical protein
MFCEYVTDPRYEWAEVCERRFGRRPVQVFPVLETVYAYGLRRREVSGLVRS